MVLAGALTAALATSALDPVARRLGLVDRPRGRHQHREPTPCTGGLAVYLAFNAACGLIFLLPWLPFRSILDIAWWQAVTASSSLVLLLGVVDDRWELPARWKLAGQVAAALTAHALGLRAGVALGVNLPWTLDLLVTTFWFVAVINAMNLIDGLDGLCSGISAIASVGLALSLLLRRQPGDALVLLGLAGACLGFLLHNLHPARAFLGDAGSMYLGFILAAASMGTGSKTAVAASIGVPLLALGVPFFDMGLAVWRRLARGRLRKDGRGGVFRGDTDHIHHRLLSAGHSQPRAAGLLYLLNAVMVGAALLAMLLRSRAQGILILAFVAVVYVTVKHLCRLELWYSAALIAGALRKPIPRQVGTFLLPAADALLLASCHALALLSARPALGWLQLKEVALPLLPFWVGLPLIALALGSNYRHVWRRARQGEYVATAGLLAAGALIAAGAEQLSLAEAASDLWRRAPAFGALAILLLVGVRASPRILVEGFALLQRDPPDGRQRRRVVAYGAGRAGTQYIRSLGLASSRLEPGAGVMVVGFLDDDPGLAGRIVHGHPVLGGGDHLERLLRDDRISAVVMTTSLRPHREQRLLALARRWDVSVLRWRAETVVVAAAAAQAAPLAVAPPARTGGTAAPAAAMLAPLPPEGAP